MAIIVIMIKTIYIVFFFIEFTNIIWYILEGDYIMKSMIKEKLSLVPNLPGCYLMKNKDGVIIYVGKAKKLKNRLSSCARI